MQLKVCANCNSSVESDDYHCAICGSTNLTPQMDSSPVYSHDYSYPSKSKGITFEQSNLDWQTESTGGDASRWLRLAGSMLDNFLSVITFGVGWFVWLCFVASKGLTPAKQFLGLRIIDAKTGFPPKFWKIFMRHYLPLLVGIISAPFSFLGWLSLPYSFAFLLTLVQYLSYALPIVDAAFIFAPGRQRLVDRMFSTRVVRK